MANSNSSDPGIRSTLVSGLQSEAARAQELGLPAAPIEGKLLRPMVALLAVPPDLRGELDHRFWAGALAIQMVHEASLLHDDILDNASVRRGRETMAAGIGVARALVEGDHLLTAAYRVAMRTESFPFAQHFSRGVERTVQGEKLQNVRVGRSLTEAEYREVVDGKSGELFGCAISLWSCLTQTESSGEARDLGIRLGRLYQRVDDFLDYCPKAGAGKEPFQDFSQKKWTWILAYAPELSFDRPIPSLPRSLFGTLGGGLSPMARALADLRSEAEALTSDLERSLGVGPEMGELLANWVRIAQEALSREESLLETATEESAGGDWLPYFANHSKTFRFASRFFPPAEERLVAGVYAFCRFTDDMVDGREDLPAYQLTQRMHGWRHMVETAYHRQDSGVPLLDQVMGETAARGVPIDYALDLIEGVSMDVTPREYASLDDLLTYTYRVASVVGLWVSELFSVREAWMLERAEALGHAMQLTNILRDVGEDWRMGRIYLPEDMRARHGVDAEMLSRMVEQGVPITPEYRALIEELMQEADRRYALAREAIPHLPTFFRRPVAVAARVYQGIHHRIRANGYDNLTLRAHTRIHHKLFLAAKALWEARGWARPGLSRPGAIHTRSSIEAYAAIGEQERLGVPT